jgi:tetratricopeptide (TPR) repeat protein
LSVTCLYLLTGISPFDLKNLDDEWVWRDFLGGKRIEPKLGEVLDRMLWPVSKRYGSAQEVLTGLSSSPSAAKTASQFFDDGLRKQNSGDHQGAIADYNQAIRLQPNHADAYYNRGLAKSNLGDNPGAISDFREAAKLYRQQGRATDYKDALDEMRKWGG